MITSKRTKAKKQKSNVQINTQTNDNGMIDNNNSIFESQKDKKRKQFFHTSSKLTKLQRKYCHCLMKVRPKIGKSIPKKNPKTGKRLNHYAVCFGGIRRKMGLHKTQKQKNKFIAMLNPRSANCVMNYNYYSYSDDEIIAMAKEYGIKTSYVSVTGEKKNLKKSTLFTKIVNKYLDKKELTKKSKSTQKSKSTKKTKKPIKK
jgi:hypothetical protein